MSNIISTMYNNTDQFDQFNQFNRFNRFHPQYYQQRHRQQRSQHEQRHQQYQHQRINNISDGNNTRQWDIYGHVAITDIRSPYQILDVRSLWTRQHRTYSEYMIGSIDSNVFVFTDWPMNHKRRLSPFRDAIRVDYDTLCFTDPQNRWMFLSDF